VIGTLINAVCILLGGLIGRLAAHAVGPAIQQRIRLLLAAATLYVAVEMIWTGLGGGFLRGLGQLGIAFLSLVLGNAAGMGMRLQKGLDRLGEVARRSLARPGETDGRFNEGFISCTLLFCVGPMAILGAIEDGLSGNFKILAVKGCMDGVATVGFTAMFGAGCALSVVPVTAYQGTLTLCAGALKPLLNEAMLDSIRVTGGLLIFTIVVVILGVRRVPLANYLPALVVAPLLTRWWM
jgi:uncharacterized membrane protein YqgA involved in biofilm formation